MRTKAEALENPMVGDRWRKGGDEWADKGCDLTIDRWNGKSGVFSQAGLMSKMFFCDWEEDMHAKFRRWAADAEYLGPEAMVEK